ncbi:hypothetical protein IL54_4318 [Sphingobium sp. ba1]|nr:hypothetical protein IL54_4318 [Sphingobium sp. ba1]
MRKLGHRRPIAAIARAVSRITRGGVMDDKECYACVPMLGRPRRL